MNLHELTVPDLRKLATSFAIPGRSSMKRPELVAAIQDYLNSQQKNVDDGTETVDDGTETIEILLDNAAMSDINSAEADISKFASSVEKRMAQLADSKPMLTLEHTHSGHIANKRMGNPRTVQANRKRNKVARKSRRKNRA